MLSKILRGAVLATFAVGATVAQAGPFEPDSANGMLKFQSVFDGKNATLNGSQGVSAGLMKGFFDNDNDLDIKEEINPFHFFCIDIDHVASGSFTDYARYKLSDLDAAAPLNIAAAKVIRLENLFDKYITSGSTLGLAVPSVASGDSAAMQLAVWNIYYDADTDYELSTGSFKATSSVSGLIGKADTMLSAAKNAADAAQQWDYTFYRFHSNERSQDYLAFTRSTPTSSGDPLPLPGTLALLGLGLAGLGLARRKS